MIKLLSYGQYVLPLNLWIARLQAHLDRAMMSRVNLEDTGAETPADEEEKSKLPIWAMVLIGVVALICIGACICLVVSILLGPSIENVFEEIESGLDY